MQIRQAVTLAQKKKLAFEIASPITLSQSNRKFWKEFYKHARNNKFSNSAKCFQKEK